MPDEPVIVYLKETGEPCAMHSVDAQDALRLGDYEPRPPEGEPKPGETAVAMARMRSTGATVHPELQSPEEREETRRQANEEADIQAASGRPVVVSPQQIGVSPQQARGSARSQPQQSESPPAHAEASPAPPQTPPRPSPGRTPTPEERRS